MVRAHRQVELELFGEITDLPGEKELLGEPVESRRGGNEGGELRSTIVDRVGGARRITEMLTSVREASARVPEYGSASSGSELPRANETTNGKFKWDFSEKRLGLVGMLLVVALLLPRSSTVSELPPNGWVLLGTNLASAALTALGLFIAWFLGTIVALWIAEKQQHDLVTACQLALLILGAIGGASAFLSILVEGNLAVWPGVAITMGVLTLCNWAGAPGVLTGIALGTGMILVAWALKIGATDIVNRGHAWLELVALRNGFLTRTVVALVPLVLAALLVRSFIHWKRLERIGRTKQKSMQMEDPAYRKLEEEKLNLQAKLRDVEDRQANILRQETG